MFNDKKYNLKYNRKRIKEQYFIDREGKKIIYQGDLTEEIISMHSQIARQCFPEINNPLDYIMKLGWIEIGSTVYTVPIIHRKPTEKQIKTLKRIKKLEYLIFPYQGDNPKLKGMMPNYLKYGILCPD